jgi:hypothetical protein
MNPSLWDNYTIAGVNGKIRYWVDAWETMIEEQDDLMVGLDLSNPHFLMRDIIDEIVFNRFANPNNRALFQRKLEFFVSNDPATKKLFAPDLALIRREFGGNRLSYLLQLTRAVDRAYEVSSYLQELYSALRAIFKESTWHDGEAEAIRIISQCLIVELQLKGYSLETIREFPARIFDQTTDFWLHNQFPGKVDEASFVRDGRVDFPAYRAALQVAVDALSISDRLDCFCSFFEPPSRPAFFIYQIEGLKGETLDITVGNVNLYSPGQKRYIKSVPGRNEQYVHAELFGSSESTCLANAAVSLNEIDARASEAAAILAIEKALDFFRVFVFSKVPFKVMTNRYIRVSPDGEYFGGGERALPRTDPAYKHFRSFDLAELVRRTDKAFLTTAGQLLFTEMHSDDPRQKLAYSLHWFRKGEEAETPEDRLLGYWIVLENIVSVEQQEHNVLLSDNQKETRFALMTELVPTLDGCLFLQHAAANLYRKLVNLMNSWTNGRQHLALPKQVADDAYLGAGPKTRVNLSTFVSHLQAVADAVDRKTVKDAILYVRRLHTDMAFAKAEIGRRLRLVKNDLLLIYRLRNRIVHNAHYENMVLPYYVEKLRGYAGETARQVLLDVCSGRARSIEECLMRYYVTLGRTQERLAKGITVDFFTLNS